MHKNLLKSQELFVKNTIDVCRLFEKDEEKGKILSALYITEKPLTKKELIDKLKVSAEKAEKVLTKAVGRGVIREVKLKGSEEIHYEVSPDAFDVMMDTIKILLKKKVDMTLKAVEGAQELIAECEGELDGNDRVVARLLYERLEHVRRVNKFLYKILKGILLKDILDIDTSHIKRVKIK